MSIRVQCEKCGSVLKIKDELAGTRGKCPKCKTAFLVPQAGEAEAVPVTTAGEAAVESPAPDPLAAKAPPSAPTAGKSAPPEPSAAKEPAARPSSSRPPAAKTPPAKPPVEKQPDPAATATPETAGSQDEEVSASNNNGSPLKGERSTDHEMEAVQDPAPPAPPAPAKPAPKAGDDEFDPAAFLMEDGGPKPKPAPASEPPRPTPPGGRRPTPMFGRKLEMSDDETDVPGAQQETKAPPARVPTGRSAADMASALLTSGSSTAASGAKDLLARSAQDSRSRSAQLPDAEPKEKTDYAGLAKALVREFGLYVVGTILLCLGLYWGMSRMFADSIPLPKLARAYGTVTQGGKPVSNILIYFTPIQTDPNSKIRPRSSMARTNENGEFDLQYLPEDGIYGAVVGKNRVSLEPISPEQFKLIPPSYQSAVTSSDIREVKEIGGEFKIEL